MNGFSNDLSLAQIERLSLLLEEMGETLQVIGKIQRHGYESFDPFMPPPAGSTNRQLLERELGDVLVAIDIMLNALDIDELALEDRKRVKRVKVQEWLHHQHS